MHIFMNNESTCRFGIQQNYRIFTGKQKHTGQGNNCTKNFSYIYVHDFSKADGNQKTCFFKADMSCASLTALITQQIGNFLDVGGVVLSNQHLSQDLPDMIQVNGQAHTFYKLMFIS